MQITYFEFKIVTEVQLGISIPRLPLWTDNTMKLYAILDSMGGSTFGKLPVSLLCILDVSIVRLKHVCSTQCFLSFVLLSDETCVLNSFCTYSSETTCQL